ncbi:MAG: NAD(P)-dependent alcohol dehydrogenase [Sediminibacterium sp.]|nr:NAD(P)-dependent alcohol dehydrogenase [Sediminibacterium sp.]
MNTKAFGAHAAQENLTQMDIQRRSVGCNDIEIDILFCGICHSDIHQARNEWRNTFYPCIPGHEIVGKVIQVGCDVKGFKIGDNVGVGCMIDSCQTCANCSNNEEQYCVNGATFTYNSIDKFVGGRTYGGYSEKIVVREEFVLRIPDSLPLEKAAPLLCAGITTYSPLRRWKISKGHKIGIIGLGGLGHVAVKIAAALGAEVIVFTQSKSKIDEAISFGAHKVVVTSENGWEKEMKHSLDFILSTVSAQYNLDTYISLLKLDGIFIVVGVPEEPLKISPINVIAPRRIFTGSVIGGIKETQEMLDFCALHQITPEIEMININQVNEAYTRIINSDVKYRFVIDMATLKN